MKTQERIKQSFNRNVKPVENENEYKRPNGVTYGNRQEFWTNFNEELYHRISVIKTKS